MNTSQHKVLITGATSGIGLELTKKFINEGNRVIAIGRNKDRLNDLKSQFRDQIDVQACDIANRDSLDQLIQYVKSNHPDLSILINNAAIQYNYDFINSENGIDKTEEEINLNLIVPLVLTHKLTQVLQQQKSAAIINVSSGLAFVPKKSAPIYCATKSGLHIFTKSLRYQLEESHIKVFEIIPPIVDTPMTKGRGKSKITVQELVDEFWKNFKKDRFEINIGKVKLLRLIQRISPRIADGILKNG